MYQAASHHFQTKRKVFLQRIYLRLYILLVFHFENCKNEDVDIEVDETSSEEELFDEEIDKTKKNLILSQKSHLFLCILEFQSIHSILSK